VYAYTNAEIHNGKDTGIHAYILWLEMKPVGQSALFLSGLKTTLFDRSWAGSTLE